MMMPLLIMMLLLSVIVVVTVVSRRGEMEAQALNHRTLSPKIFTGATA